MSDFNISMSNYVINADVSYDEPMRYMLTQQGRCVKTDARDMLMITHCLLYGGYHPVYILTEGQMDGKSGLY